MDLTGHQSLLGHGLTVNVIGVLRVKLPRSSTVIGMVPVGVALFVTMVRLLLAVPAGL